MARTPLAARISIDPAFSDGYESNYSGEVGGHSLEEAEIRPPIDLTSRTPMHIRFAESGLNQLAEYPAASGSNLDQESYSSQIIAIRNMKEQLSHHQSEISEMRRISLASEILDHQSCDSRIDSNGQIAQEELLRTAPLDLYSLQIVEASSNVESVDTGSAPSTVMMDCRVRLSKCCSIVQTSTEIAKKHTVSNKDKTFDILDKALRASNLLSLVDGPRKKPGVTNLNSSGYSAEAIIATIEADGSKSYTVIAEDDYYKFYAESIMVFTFMLSMINEDMKT